MPSKFMTLDIMKSISGLIKSILFIVLVLFHLSACIQGTLKENIKIEPVFKCDVQADEYLKAGDFKQSILLHRKFLEENPSNGMALYHLGYAYGQTGNHEMEVFYYEKAIKQGFTDQGIYYNLGMAYGELNELEKSIQVFQKLIHREPDNLDGRLILGMLYGDIGDLKNAEKQIKYILQADPEHREAREFMDKIKRRQD